LERYRGLLIGGGGIAGALVVLFLLLGNAAGKPFTCGTLLTPGPVESLAPRPSIISTPTPAATATPAPTGTPAASPAATSAATPAASGSPAPSGSPAAGTPAPSGSAAPSASAPSGSAAPSASPTASPTAPPPPTPRLGFTTTIQGNTHVSGGTVVNYGFCPPTSGDHINAPPRGPIPAQFYGPNEEKAPNGWVHNLEHGYVALLYRCPGGAAGAEGCPSQAELDQMRQWFDTAPAPTKATCPKKVLVGRFDEMDTRFALVAWGRAFLFDEFNLDTALTFAQQWMEHDAVPEPSSC
jgi:hypothetical protein